MPAKIKTKALEPIIIEDYKPESGDAFARAERLKDHTGDVMQKALDSI